MSSTDWTAEDDARLRELLADRALTFQQVADATGRTPGEAWARCRFLARRASGPVAETAWAFRMTPAELAELAAVEEAPPPVTLEALEGRIAALEARSRGSG